MVVTTVLAKKKDWPKLHEGTLVPFSAIETPRSLAFTISAIKSSSEESGEKVRLVILSSRNDQGKRWINSSFQDMDPLGILLSE